MEIKVYDRKSNKMIIEKQYKKGYLDFLYKTIPGRILLKYFFSSKLFSKLYSIYLNTKASVRKIEPFIKKYNIDMSDYKNKQYKSFNDFFVREIEQGKRPYSSENSTLISPADARLTVYRIDGELKINIKKSIYRICELLRYESIACQYHNGTCLVFRLTVDDYHRYHYIDDGYISEHKVINGILHTVSPISSERYNVYSENQREVSILKGENLGEFIQVEVGAILVGKITNHSVEKFSRGDERGYFSFGGSTIILMFREGTVQVDADIMKLSEEGIETKVRMGEKIGGIKKCLKD